MTSPTPSVPSLEHRLEEVERRLRVVEGQAGSGRATGSQCIAFSPYNNGALALWPSTALTTWSRLWVWRAVLEWSQLDVIVYQATSIATVVGQLRLIMDDTVTIWESQATAGTVTLGATVDLTDTIGDRAGSHHKFALEGRLTATSPAGTLYALMEGLVMSRPI